MSDHYEGQDLEALADMPNYADWIMRTFGPYLRGRVIEVGAGIGSVSCHYVDRTDAAVLIEPAANLHAQLKARFADRPHVQPLNTLLRNAPPEVLKEPFDAALMVNVLEHIDDHALVLRRLHDCLGERGVLLLFVPALPALYGSLDRLVHHYRRYTIGGLADLVNRAGFYPVMLRYFDLAGVVPWFVAGRLLERERFDAGPAKLYDRFGVPVTRFIERHIVPPLGKSLVCVARRR